MKTPKIIGRLIMGCVLACCLISKLEAQSITKRPSPPLPPLPINSFTKPANHLFKQSQIAARQAAPEGAEQVVIATNLLISIDNGTNAALHWPSEPTNAFIIGYRTTLSAATPWTLLTNVLAATNGVQTDFTNQGAITSSSSGFYVVSKFSEDFDGDGVDNGTELLLGTDPFTPDDAGNASYPSAPSVYSGEVVINYDTNSETAGNFGPFLYADSITVNDMTTTEPTPGELHLTWHSSVVDHYDSFVQPNDDSSVSFTPEEVAALRDAFGQGTSISGGIISTPNQTKVDALPVDLLEKI